MRIVLKVSPPNDLVRISPGFPLKACGNTDLKSGNCHYATGCGGLTPTRLNCGKLIQHWTSRHSGLTLHNQLELSLAQPSGAAFRDRHGIAEAGAAFALCGPDLGFENERHAGL